MMAVCPKCDVALILLEFKGIQVDYCPACCGLWLDVGEVEQLLIRTGGTDHNPFRDFVIEHIRSEVGRPAYLCPRCDAPMKEVASPAAEGYELRLDCCPRGDGIWFDKNELQLLYKSLPPEAKAGKALELLQEVLGDYTTQQEGEHK